MLTTIEVRWFYRGTIPKEVKNWFGQDILGKHPSPPEEREDWYLYSPWCDRLGIKMRGGNLEIKWRLAELGVQRFGDGLEGKTEKWLKWISEKPKNNKIIPANVGGKALWIGVRKERSQRKYEGCTMELTKLIVQNEAWWSLAFEASGEEAQEMNNLQAIASEIFKNYPGMALQIHDSFGYPKWLSLTVGEN
ncbi:hypothetical protein H6F77_21160 [Microcoleus sp. FACHB-831]|uniref:hypothetical protein n=1 Tax=Microcoleus sp. FACHB-831 TaxID=2692827 RepID=UPI0016893856|nr:hypothetical protein [Microcoleus sp. FACHB-831]MBD1923561.1 hypothetical protein [Microcoleus sp. FACHB-831]